MNDTQLIHPGKSTVAVQENGAWFVKDSSAVYEFNKEGASLGVTSFQQMAKRGAITDLQVLSIVTSDKGVVLNDGSKNYLLPAQGSLLGVVESYWDWTARDGQTEPWKGHPVLAITGSLRGTAYEQYLLVFTNEGSRTRFLKTVTNQEAPRL